MSNDELVTLITDALRQRRNTQAERILLPPPLTQPPVQPLAVVIQAQEPESGYDSDEDNDEDYEVVR